MKRYATFQSLIWFSILVLTAGVISTGIMTNMTLRSVKKQLPNTLLTELNDLALILENLADAVIAARLFKDKPDTDTKTALQKKIQPVFNGIVKLRESYVIDNLVHASDFHSIVAPAILDIRIWLDEGVSGLAPENEITSEIVFLRINEAYRKSRLVSHNSRAKAQTQLIEQQKRLGRFILNVNILFILAALIAFVMVFLMIRQHTLQERDVKVRKLIEEHKKLSLVGRIAGKMAHDFNNVLGIIMGNAELLLLSSKEKETLEISNIILEQTLRGKNLTKNLIAFAKDQEPRQEFFNINDKIKLVIKLLKKDLEGIKLKIERADHVPDLLADPGMIEHALVNLFQNSIHALSKVRQPEITIRMARINGQNRGPVKGQIKHQAQANFKDHIRLEIADNGCGIPKDQLAYIYEPSFTLKGSRDVLGAYSPGIKGTGYGMANVKKYIEQHGGSISVTSATGTGTTFTILLPIIKKDLTKKEKFQLVREKMAWGKRILLVEDEPSLSEVQYRILTGRPCSHNVEIADTGQTAIQLFDTHEYELISLDYVLPGAISGMDVYHHIRKKNSSIPILFISGNIEFLESIKKLKENDKYIEHLSKPCLNKEYVSAINRLLAATSTRNRFSPGMTWNTSLD